MGTRLYPKTRNVSVLERLAGVPAGTHQLLEQLEAQRQSMGSEAYYDLLANNPDADYLDNFLLFGWGKLTSEQWEVAKELLGPDDCWHGSTTDIDAVKRMLAGNYNCTLNGVSIEELEGVYWG